LFLFEEYAMAQTPHDQLAKQYLEAFLAPFGVVERQYEVPGEAKHIDVWFVPKQVNRPPEDLGLLGQMIQTPCVLEPYRNVPSRTEIRVAVMKLIWVQEDERRKAKVDELPEDELPVLWVLAAKASKPLLREANVVSRPGWPLGVYFVADIFKTAIVAIDQLPVIPETLLLRVLGRDDTQKVAIEEVIALPVGLPTRRQILRLVASWKVRMDLGELEDFVQREEIMTITKAFEAWEQETENKARQTRNVEIALNMLKDSLPPEQISRLTGLTIAQIEDIQIKAK
jgi:hypothetical protein